MFIESEFITFEHIVPKFGLMYVVYENGEEEVSQTEMIYYKNDANIYIKIGRLCDIGVIGTPLIKNVFANVIIGTIDEVRKRLYARERSPSTPQVPPPIYLRAPIMPPMPPRTYNPQPVPSIQSINMIGRGQRALKTNKRKNKRRRNRTITRKPILVKREMSDKTRNE